ncbi:cellulase family glycosylhydrolase [Reichenbachiella ulvae]|uniref:Exo-1,3-beta-glucanase D n=1 Tax=Reichenbachiella ulvae TaxID=2980104 RepID=A0ABT3CUN3_9BACT|nr:cellulase family glycosylhydrolase [Reichenbachiella ulvae]MCV9387401.1 cellulase family glycosylhydrolase [Reichenbachiella ulvae]
MRVSIRCQLSALIVICTMHTAWSQMTDADFLKANGTVLRNQSGQGDTINLRGTNLGSWLSLEYWMCPLGTGSLDRRTWQATTYDGATQESLQALFDRDLTTGWTSTDVQSGGQYLEIDMQKEVVFNRISFEAGGFTSQYPREYTVEASLNKTNWQTIASGTGTTEDIFIQLPAIYEQRYLRISQTGSDTEAKWSVAELNLYMEDDFHVRNSLSVRFGEDGMDEILDHYQETWITSDDLDRIQAMGMNMVRVPFYWMELMYNDGSIKTNGFTQLDWVIEECNQRNMYVILDMHGGPGGWNGFITSGQAHTNDIWTDKDSQQMAIDIWKAIAARYKGNPTVAAYDLMNEPLSSNQELYPIHGLYNKIYQEVRQIDPDHVISIGAFPGFGFVVGPEYYGWENVLYQAHHYNEDKTNHDSQLGFADWAIRDMANHQHIWQVPILAGEFNFWTFSDVWEYYFNGLNASNISWSNWAYKTKRVDTPKENWGYYDANTNPAPDIHYDTKEEIEAKWSEFGTEQFRTNTELINIVTPHTKAAVSKPRYGHRVWLMSYADRYMTSAGDDPMVCNQSTRELFELVDAGDGKVAFETMDGKYLGIVNGGAQLKANKTSIGETEKFTFVDLGNRKMALMGSNGKFVSAEEASNPMTCNRDYADGWEVFQWGSYAPGVLTVADFVHSDSLIYPNPSTGTIQLKTGFDQYLVEIFDLRGCLRMALADSKDGDWVDISSLESGTYVVKISSANTVVNKKLVVGIQ